jgi:hypothetical protein
MSYGTSIDSHVYNPPITAGVLCGISREQGWRPGTILNSAPSQLEIETQLAMDRLLRDCFTSKSARGTGRIDTPDTHPRPPGGGKISDWDPLFSDTPAAILRGMANLGTLHIMYPSAVIAKAARPFGR